VSPKANESSTSDRTEPRNTDAFWWSITLAVIVWFLLTLSPDLSWFRGLRSPIAPPEWDHTPTPLVMRGGDPYIRALMRTISASESNSPRPYSILYGGQHLQDLSRHPDLCITIVSGPNTGDCTTAAGRYQMLTTTWYSKAKAYHPRSPFLFFGQDYSFEAEYQDEVVYHWLNDPSAWGVDLAELLREGQVNEVLRILSPTWTSLGYGIETNSMSSFLPEIYGEMLEEELQGR
jgi:muramidase (phage lysozyme)